MATLNIKPNALFTADNLYVLNGMNSECVDLIYLDPPFNSKRLYKAPVGSKAAGAAFEDMWSWEDVDSALMVRLAETHPYLVDYITAIEVMHSKGMMAYIAYMAQRLFEMHRVLKPTGSIYLHCDPTASHYLKIVMDRIFGAANFRNEIVWQRASGRAKGSQHQPKSFGQDTDAILFYTKDKNAFFAGAFQKPNDKELKKKFPHKDARGRYNTTVPLFRQPSMGDRPNLCYEYNGVSNPHPSGWRVSKEKLAKMDANDEIIWRDGKRPLRKSYAHNYAGKPLGGLWADIPNITTGKELTGYPTQKPLALLNRIIKASSNEGDVVLDPFCGCATTCVAAQQLGRQWIGIDISETTEVLIRDRLADDVGAMFNDFTHYAKPPARGDVKPMTKQEAKPLLYGAQAGHCAGCKEHFEMRHLEVDHDIPKSKGGGDYLDNYQLMCGHCNRTKGNRPMEYLLSVIAKRKAQRRIFGATPAASGDV